MDEACRAVIRSELRKRALEQGKKLVVRARVPQPPRQSQPRVRLFPNLIIPLMDSSDEDQPHPATIMISPRRFPDSPITFTSKEITLIQLF